MIYIGSFKAANHVSHKKYILVISSPDTSLHCGVAFPILRSDWYGLKLIGVVFVIQFGVETFMIQIETLYFNRSLQVKAHEMMELIASGALRALIFAPLAVILLHTVANLALDAFLLPGTGEYIFKIVATFGAVMIAVAWMLPSRKQRHVKST